MLDKGFDDGDAVCRIVYSRLTDYLSFALVNMITLLNPALVLIGGELSNAGDRLLVPLQEKIDKGLIDEALKCPVKKAALGGESGMYGACKLVKIRLEENSAF